MYVSTLLLACGSGLTPFGTSPPADGTPTAGIGTPPPPTGGEGPPPTGPGTEDTATTEPALLVARVDVDVAAGPFPLTVTFDPSASDLGSGSVSYAWSFGDGATATDVLATHTYVGAGSFVATLALRDQAAGGSSTAEVTIDVSVPACPVGLAPRVVGYVSDGELSELSGIVASRVDPEVSWVHEDSGNDPVLIALDGTGLVLSRHEVAGTFADFEDLAAATDPVTGRPLLFLGDIGDNGSERDEVAVWVTPEPDARTDGPAAGTRMALTYPDGPHDAETLLVDPATLDVYVVTKESDGPASLFVKRAPHVGGGPFVLEGLGSPASLELVATGGDVSSDGSRVVVRDYGTTARLWFRDGLLPFEDAFARAPCEVTIAQEQQGEAIAFTLDGAGVVTVSEGSDQPLFYVGL